MASFDSFPFCGATLYCRLQKFDNVYNNVKQARAEQDCKGGFRFSETCSDKICVCFLWMCYHFLETCNLNTLGYIFGIKYMPGNSLATFTTMGYDIFSINKIPCISLANKNIRIYQIT